MARKPAPATKIGTEVRGPSSPAPVTKISTEVRNSPIPKTTPAPAKKEITHAMIAERAYFISKSGQGGSEYDNWIRAEKELRA